MHSSGGVLSRLQSGNGKKGVVSDPFRFRSLGKDTARSSKNISTQDPCFLRNAKSLAYACKFSIWADFYQSDAVARRHSRNPLEKESGQCRQRSCLSEPLSLPSSQTQPGFLGRGPLHRAQPSPSWANGISLQLGLVQRRTKKWTLDRNRRMAVGKT